ncbi:MAG TPA: Rnase Y domain-containing protein, partial [Alphaproteobacteria bacterium]|nr:Rnase Y domain-containing protein [Alphaproteobacteria bacterium]
MTAVEAAMFAAIVILAVLVAAMLVIGLRLLRRLTGPTNPSGGPLSVIVDDPEAVAERERQRQTLTELQAAVAQAQSALENERKSVTVAQAEAVAARAEAAAAKAEVATSRAEAQRVLDNAHSDADSILQRAHRQAEEDAEQLRLTTKRTGEREIALLTATAKEQAAEAERRLQRLDERERMHAEEAERLAERERMHAEEAERLAERDRRIATAETELAKAEAQLTNRRLELEEAEEEHRRELERVAGLTSEQAKVELVETIEAQAKREAALLVREIENEARSNGEQRARHIVVDAIQRVASEQTAESVVSVLHLPSDEMKGRIIGREGRNIRAFETVTGVNLIIDDTPEAVLLSCFDPVRREIGRLTLEKLVLDGRIHPHRIEEVHDLARLEVERMCRRAAEDALVQVGITDIDDELVTLLGRLRYRTSYGQNVLKHLVE